MPIKMRHWANVSNAPEVENYASLLTVFQEPVIKHFSAATATPVSSNLAAGGNNNDARKF